MYCMMQITNNNDWCRVFDDYPKPRSKKNTKDEKKERKIRVRFLTKFKNVKVSNTKYKLSI